MRILTAFILVTASCTYAQNLTTVTAANIQKAGAPLVSGTLCFTATDANDTPVGFRIGGGGQEVVAPYCATVTNGAIVGTFSVANPANTSPANIQYRIEVFDQYTRVLKYAGVQFTGPTFNLDNYVPAANLPLGASVNVLSVGNLTVTGSCSGCAAGSGYNLVEVAGSALAQRLTLNFVSGVSCSDNPSQSRTDCTVSGGGAGTVTSVGLALPNIFSVSGSPVTTSGTLTGALANQSANTVFAGPPSGVAATPGFRALVAADIPNNAANTTGNAATATALAVNGTNCSAGNYPLGVDASGNAEGCTAIPSGSGTPSPSGALVELPLTDCSGTTAADISGNGNNGTLHGSPTWGPAGICGLTFGTDTTKWVSLPAGLSATARTFLAFVKAPNPAGLSNYVTLFGTDSASGSDLLLYATFDGSVSAANNKQHVFTPAVFDVTGGQVTTVSAEAVGGYESVAWVSDATADRLYINGSESSFYQVHGGSAAHIAGTITFGADERSAGTACSACAFPGTIYYVMIYPRELTAAEVAEADNYMRQRLIQRGLQINPAPAAADGTNQLACVGDSLTDGFGATSYCSQLSGLTEAWSATNFGVPSYDLKNIYAIATGVDSTAFTVNNMRRVVTLWAGTNDVSSGSTVNPSAAFDRLLQVTNRYHLLGDKVIWLSMISRTGTGFGGSTNDSLKDSYNALMRKWPEFGVEGFVDLGEDTNFGADGTNNSANFQADHIHLTTAAQGVVAGYVSNALNMLESGPLMQPTVFTTTATMASSDLNGEGDTTAGAFTLTLPSCAAKTGYIYKIKNEPAANTLTVAGNGSDLIDGASTFTLAQHASAQLQIVVKTPASSGGCRWRKLN